MRDQGAGQFYITSVARLNAHPGDGGNRIVSVLETRSPTAVPSCHKEAATCCPAKTTLSRAVRVPLPQVR